MSQGEFEFDGWHRDEASKEDLSRFASYRVKILEMLLDGPKTTNELKVVAHRFSCCKHDLQKRGYKIIKEYANGGYLYTLVGFEKTSCIPEKARDAYYRTKHWRKIRLERMAFDGYQCVLCASKERLECHHWRYDLFKEQLQDLTTLCRECHKRIHGNKSISIHFPDVWRKRTVDRLKQFAKLIDKKRGQS